MRRGLKLDSDIDYKATEHSPMRRGLKEEGTEK
jgi:hypothetical protein